MRKRHPTPCGALSRACQEGCRYFTTKSSFGPVSALPLAGCPGGIHLAVAGPSRSRQGGVRRPFSACARAYDDARWRPPSATCTEPRLHGFAILVTLGDRRAAERAAGFALAAGAEQAAALRHPERAAAWLRARTLRTLGSRGCGDRRRLRRGGPRWRRSAWMRRSIVAWRPSASTPGRLSWHRRSSGFDPIDVETILDAAPAATRHTVAEARSRYLRHATGIRRRGRCDRSISRLASSPVACKAWRHAHSPRATRPDERGPSALPRLVDRRSGGGSAAGRGGARVRVRRNAAGQSLRSTCSRTSTPAWRASRPGPPAASAGQSRWRGAWLAPRRSCSARRSSAWWSRSSSACRTPTTTPSRRQARPRTRTSWERPPRRSRAPRQRPRPRRR